MQIVIINFHSLPEPRSIPISFRIKAEISTTAIDCPITITTSGTDASRVMSIGRGKDRGAGAQGLGPTCSSIRNAAVDLGPALQPTASEIPSLSGNCASTSSRKLGFGCMPAELEQELLRSLQGQYCRMTTIQALISAETSGRKKAKLHSSSNSYIRNFDKNLCQSMCELLLCQKRRLTRKEQTR